MHTFVVPHLLSVQLLYRSASKGCSLLCIFLFTLIWCLLLSFPVDLSLFPPACPSLSLYFSLCMFVQLNFICFLIFTLQSIFLYIQPTNLSVYSVNGGMLPNSIKYRLSEVHQPESPPPYTLCHVFLPVVFSHGLIWVSYGTVWKRRVKWVQTKTNHKYKLFHSQSIFISFWLTIYSITILTNILIYTTGKGMYSFTIICNWRHIGWRQFGFIHVKGQRQCISPGPNCLTVLCFSTMCLTSVTLRLSVYILLEEFLVDQVS